MGPVDRKWRLIQPPNFASTPFFRLSAEAISANRKTSVFEPKSHPEPFDRPRLVRHFREAPVSIDQPSPRQHRFSPKTAQKVASATIHIFGVAKPLSRFTGPTDLRHSRSKPPYRICSGVLARKKFAYHAHFCRCGVNHWNTNSSSD